MGYSGFMEFAESKIRPVIGDLTADELGLSASDLEIVTNEVNVIINSAASINFEDPIKEALSINYFGA